MKRVSSYIGNNYPGEGPYVTAAVTVGERGKVGLSTRSVADNGDDSLVCVRLYTRTHVNECARVISLASILILIAFRLRGKQNEISVGASLN